ncbi:MAG: Na+/H+ antiporter subunit G [Ectothiorhodospiraceae bacterium]|nr:Na+/H+ antiporter subunit G [Ectothiorhodospiraceae bacterium]
MAELLDILVAFLILAGGAFALIGSIGLARLPDFFTRLHGPSKATTLGIGGLLVGSAVHFSVLEGGLSLHEFLITVFVALTTPISAHLLAKAGLHRRLPGSEAYRAVARDAPRLDEDRHSSHD